MSRQMISKFDGFCRNCRRTFPAGTEILWEPGNTRHASCPPCFDCAQVQQPDGSFTHKADCPTQKKEDKPFVPFAGFRHSRPFNASAPAAKNFMEKYEEPLDEIDLSGINVGFRGSRFAIPFDGEGAFDGHFFCRIDAPDPAKDARWGGNVFVRWIFGPNEKMIGRQFKGETGYRSLKQFANRFEALLSAIAADPETYKQLYGQRIGKCGHCNKRLTDAESRKFGIGPECRKNLGL